MASPMTEWSARRTAKVMVREGSCASCSLNISQRGRAFPVNRGHTGPTPACQNMNFTSLECRFPFWPQRRSSSYPSILHHPFVLLRTRSRLVPVLSMIQLQVHSRANFASSNQTNPCITIVFLTHIESCERYGVVTYMEHPTTVTCQDANSIEMILHASHPSS